jgi:3-oxoacyl-[acyl-carrier protein] reductase
MAEKFKNKNILIIGANGGIGGEIAKRVLAEGGNVYAAGRTRPELDVEFASWDATQPDEAAFANLPDVLHGFVYCAGTINLKPFGRFSLEDFENDWKINVLGAVAALQPNITRLKKAKNSGVVFFSTVAANTGLSFHTSIATAKSALQGLSLALASEYSAAGIRFNVVAPSLTDTPLAENLLSTEEKRDASAKRHPLGRFGSASDMAAAATFLLSDEAGWITGQVLGIDGGLGRLK